MARRDQVRRRYRAIVAVAAALSAFPAAAEAATVVNGGFETGDFTGWTVYNQPGGSGDWFNYTGTSSPVTGFTISAPPEGSRAATTDQGGPGTHILYQDVVLPAGETHAFSASVYYENRATDFFSPETLDYTGDPNQQYRVDIMKPSAAVDSVAASDVLLKAFFTSPGDPNSRAPGTITADLSPFAGQTVRLRFAEVDNQFFFQASVDDVKVASSSAAPDLCFGKPATITGSGVVNGTNGDDVIITGNAPDTVDGKGGNDLICTHGGDDYVRGGAGDDKISAGNDNDNAGGQAGNDLVQGGNGADDVQGGAGDDTVRGGFGNDTLNGGDGADDVRGEEDDDLMAGNAGAPDSCDGGTGTDQVTASHGCESITNVP